MMCYNLYVRERKRTGEGKITVIFLYSALLLTLAVLISFPYIRVAYRRLMFIRGLREYCLKEDIKFRLLNKFAVCSSNTNQNFDFILRVGKTAIPVKFYSAVHPHSTLIMGRAGKACERRKVRDVLPRTGEAENKTLNYGKSLPRPRIKKAWIGDRHTCLPVVLNYPQYASVMTESGDGVITEADSSTTVSGCRWLSSREFMSLVRGLNEEVKTGR